MSVERKPASFGDQRGWIAALRKEGELHEVTAEVDWNIELGTIMRLAQGTGDGPALLFSNIKDYNKKSSRGSKVFGCSLCRRTRIRASWSRSRARFSPASSRRRSSRPDR